jgi:dTDP-4-dehydrorhamnose reductase
MARTRILIIGAEGQLGREFHQALEQQALDVFAPKEKDCSLTDASQLRDVIRKSNPDVVINCAGYNAVDQAEEEQDVVDLVNHKAVSDLAQLCRESQCRLVHYSSDYVFDGTKQDLYLETDETNPLNVYGKSKLAGEQVALNSSSDNLVFRLSWVIGKGQQNFLFKLSNWAKNNHVLKISADEVSVPTFTHDIVRLTLDALDKGLTGLYQMTSSGYASRYELAKFFGEVSELDNVFVPVPMSEFETKAKRPGFSAMINNKLSQDLNVRIPDWQDSLRLFVKG